VRLFKRKPQAHAVAVYDTRPLPDDKQFDPYFVAMCDCGWVGRAWKSSEEAFKDAYEHDPNVSKEIRQAAR
jgi:hypothetical protein